MDGLYLDLVAAGSIAVSQLLITRFDPELRSLFVHSHHVCVGFRFGFPLTFQTYAGKWIGCTKLPLGMNEVCAWCPAMDLHLIHGQFFHLTPSDPRTSSRSTAIKHFQGQINHF